MVNELVNVVNDESIINHFCQWLTSTSMISYPPVTPKSNKRSLPLPTHRQLFTYSPAPRTDSPPAQQSYRLTDYSARFDNCPVITLQHNSITFLTNHQRPLLSKLLASILMCVSRHR